MGTVGLFRYFLEVRPSRGSWHSDRHCTWALDVETLPLVPLPWRVLLFRFLLCLPFWVGLLWPRAGVRVCVCVWVCGWGWVGVGVGVCVWVPAGLRCWLESRFLHVPMF